MPSLMEKASAKPLTAVILLGLILFLSGNWILPLMDRDEPRFAEASREMLQRGDLVIPWFNNQYRFD
jgi:4-amino-4-deoxy-L-arabinose transferase-like glycosyltransferase